MHVRSSLYLLVAYVSIGISTSKFKLIFLPLKISGLTLKFNIFYVNSLWVPSKKISEFEWDIKMTHLFHKVWFVFQIQRKASHSLHYPYNTGSAIRKKNPYIYLEQYACKQHITNTSLPGNNSVRQQAIRYRWYTCIVGVNELNSIISKSNP